MARFRYALPALLALAAPLVARPAAAQMENRVLQPTDVPTAPTGPAQKPIPGVPGSQSQTGSAAPAERVPMDMPPTQALFDAINRGDITAARDSLNRGADIDARNVLGMTPLDSSIDLGRNDISFLLLSMRGAGSAASQPATAAAAPPKSARPTRIAREPRHGTERVATTAAAPAVPQKPQLFADDGGTPAPQVGFLGFGTRSR